MGLSFPTGHTGHGARHTGQPLRPEARHLCHCGPQMLPDEDGSCVRCGRYPKTVVDRTWSERAAFIAARGRKRRVAA